MNRWLTGGFTSFSILFQSYQDAGPRSAAGRASDSEPEVPGSVPGLVSYFRFSLRRFKKGSCQSLAKIYA